MNAVKKMSMTESIIAQKPAYEYNKRILIVEDEPSIAEGIKNIISPQNNVIQLNRSSRQKNTLTTPNQNAAAPASDNFEVVCTNTPKEALHLIQKSISENKPFAMGFFDVLLNGDIDGIELVKQIQAIDSKIFAVFVTAYHDRTVDAINQFLGPENADRWDYMNKPFTEGAILQKARNSVAIWNLREIKRTQDEQLAEATNLLLQGERSNTVAAVGRSMAHEFGNILMQIIGHAELSLMKNDTEHMKKTLGTILKAGETAANVLSKFKKVNNSEDGVEFKLININQCVDEAIDLMNHEFRKSNVKVNKVKYDVCLLEANYHSLVQVFVNIFINSIHAMSPSGQIDVGISQVTLNEGVNPEFWIEINIRDYGPGIPEAILDKVTDAFFTTKGKNGTGLGLAITKEIIEAEHLGELSIKNHPEKGLEIKIKLPARQEVTNG